MANELIKIFLLFLNKKRYLCSFFLDTLKHRPYIIGECELNRRVQLYEYVYSFVCEDVYIIEKVRMYRVSAMCACVRQRAGEHTREKEGAREKPRQKVKESKVIEMYVVERPRSSRQSHSEERITRRETENVAKCARQWNREGAHYAENEKDGERKRERAKETVK